MKNTFQLSFPAFDEYACSECGYTENYVARELVWVKDENWRLELKADPSEEPTNCPNCKTKSMKCIHMTKNFGQPPVNQYKCPQCGYTEDYTPTEFEWVRASDDE
jgi:predicted RNA-binding Zn-ribbon protein involved in translation (DUF1610 family)